MLFPRQEDLGSLRPAIEVRALTLVAAKRIGGSFALVDVSCGKDFLGGQIHLDLDLNVEM